MGKHTQRERHVMSVGNAAQARHKGISTVGRVENKHYDKLPQPVTSDKPQRASAHLHRGDGSAYWEFNQGR